jgi:hypothetical protein
MTASEDKTKYNEVRFLALISGLSGGAMQHLGKVVNPLTGKIERDLEAAKGTIDILRMLREKTKGNLTDREERTLNSLINGLELNYLDEVKAEAEKPKEKAEEKAEEKPEEKPQRKRKEEPPQKEKEEEPAEQEQAAGEEKSEQAPADKNQPPE